MASASAFPAAAGRDLTELSTANLSPWFNPFLSHFAREARRCGGEARVLRENDSIVGLFVSDPVERISTAFTRSRSLAEEFVRGRGAAGVFADFRCEPSAEAFDVFALRFGLKPLEHRFRHPLRPYAREDFANVLALVREVYGTANERWFEGLPNESESGFVSEVGGRLAGVGWVCRAGPHARLHSVTVRAPYRRMGIGTDLLFARLISAERTGAADVFSEISRNNLVSERMAASSGMTASGQIYFHPPRSTER